MRSTKRVLYSGLAAVGIVAGAAGLANATTSSANRTDSVAVADADPTADTDTRTADNGQADIETDDNEQDPSYTSSLTVADSTDGADSGNETDESAALQGLARITADDASAAALASHPGTVITVELENENGNVVYAVEVDNGSGTVDVKVDAGNGTVLSSEADDQNEADGENEAENDGENEAEDGPDHADEQVNGVDVETQDD